MMTQEPLPTLRDYRVNFGLTLAAVATRLGCTAGHIEDLEAGAVVPNETEVIALAEIYDEGQATMWQAVDATREARKGRRKPRNGRLEIIERQSIS